MNSLSNHTDPNKTVRHALPYAYFIRDDGNLVITNVHGQKLIVSRTEVVYILGKEDLDPHRRRMYETALAEFDKVSHVQ